ncbi:MAG: GIY-YIG nuclease family protein [Pirellulales bacterium]
MVTNESWFAQSQNSARGIRATSKAGWGDDYLAQRESINESDHSNGSFKDELSGYVYLAKTGRHYKIGKTNSSGRREYEIGLQLPEKLQMVHVIATDDPTGIEAYWHKRFDAKRKNGEWFELTREDVQAFKRRRKFM